MHRSLCSSLLVSFSICLGLAACGGSGKQQTPVDLSTPAGDLAGQQQSGDMAMSNTDMQAGNGCNGIYSKSAIAAMRQNASGCYELDNVVTLAVTPVSANSHSVTIFAQDSAGMAYSGIVMACSSTSTSHMCTAFPTAKSILAGRSVTVQGLYIKSSAMKGGFEQFYIDSITDNAAGTPPAPAAVTLANIERGGNVPAMWFQMVTTTIAAADQLQMYDWTPVEFTGTGSCPQYGFGMLPKSVSGATAGAACPTTTPYTQPAGVANPNAAEVLVGTDFYGGFTYTTSCACGPMYMDPVPTAAQGVKGAITALLDYDVPFGSTTGYQFLDPLTNANFMIQ